MRYKSSKSNIVLDILLRLVSREYYLASNKLVFNILYKIYRFSISLIEINKNFRKRLRNSYKDKL